MPPFSRDNEDLARFHLHLLVFFRDIFKSFLPPVFSCWRLLFSYDIYFICSNWKFLIYFISCIILNCLCVLKRLNFLNLQKQINYSFLIRTWIKNSKKKRKLVGEHIFLGLKDHFLWTTPLTWPLCSLCFKFQVNRLSRLAWKSVNIKI